MFLIDGVKETSGQKSQHSKTAVIEVILFYLSYFIFYHKDYFTQKNEYKEQRNVLQELLPKYAVKCIVC